MIDIVIGVTFLFAFTFTFFFAIFFLVLIKVIKFFVILISGEVDELKCIFVLGL